MHSYYFDRPDLEAAEPSTSAPAPPPLEAPLRRTAPPPRRPPRPVVRRRPGGRKRRRAVLILAAFLTVTLGGSALLLALGLSGFLPGTITTLPADIHVGPAESQTPETTVARAPAGEGTPLALAAQTGRQELTPRQIYRKVLPSVVSVQSTVPKGVSQGTGIILSGDGYILTNHHVIEGASTVQVERLDGGGAYDARLVGSDAKTDLAVLKVEAQGLLPAEFGDSGLLQVGDPAYAIGNPLGAQLPGTMTEGIVSYLDRTITVDGNTMTLIQTDAALNSGNSGGALVNAYGQVVGITTLKMRSEFNTIEGLGFAIPSVTVKEIGDQLMAQGHVTGRPVLGITAGPSAAYGNGTDLPEGLYVASVDPASDAWAKGLREGDVICAANGCPTLDIAALNAQKAGLAAGDTLTLTVWRDGAERTLTVALIEEWTLSR